MPVKTLPKFAANLKRVRLERGVSQEKLAVTAGLSHHQIYRYESQKEVPRLVNAEALARALGVSLDTLVRG